MANWTHCRGNAGRCEYISDAGGIAGETAVWKSNTLPMMIYQSVCIADSTIYLMGMCEVIALRIESGEEIWRVTLPCGLEKAPVGLVLNDDILVAGGYVLDRTDGRLIQDMSTHTDAEVAQFRDSYLCMGGVLRPLDDDTLFWLSPDGECRHYDVKLDTPFVSEDGRYVIGWDAASLTCLDLSTGESHWNFDAPKNEYGGPQSSAVFCISEGEVIAHLNYDDLWRVHIDSGEMLLRTHRAVSDDRPVASPDTPSSLVAAPDRLYLFTRQRPSGAFNSYSRDTGEAVFEHNFDNLHSVFGYNDMLYGYNRGGQLFGWDRYSGEQIYQSKDALPGTCNMVASNGYIVLNNLTGGMMCFKSDAPWYSTADK